MIVRMKKVAVIVQHKDAVLSLKRLRSLGVLHIENAVPPSGKDINSFKKDTESLEKAIEILSGAGVRGKICIRNTGVLKDWRFVVRHVIDFNARLDRLNEYSRKLSASINEQEAWGDFNPESVLELQKKGIRIKLYKAPVKKLKLLPESVVTKIVSVSGGIANLAVVSLADIDVPFKEVELPKISLEQAKKRFYDNEEVRLAIIDSIRKHACFIEGLVKARAVFLNESEFHAALSGIGKAERVSYITGYAPDYDISRIREAAQSERWGLYVTDPSENDAVPTLVKNPKWIAIINPVFKFIEIIPGYHELDISLWFLIFFSIFFGMLIGDAGDGIVFLLLTFLAHRKFGAKAKDKSIFFLFYLLSSCAIAWGVLSGTFFGQAWIPETVKPLLPALRDDKKVQEICFFIGVIHLTIAHSWQAIIKLPSILALADAGWISILWGGFFLAKTLILGQAFPVFGKWFFMAGCALVVLFTSPNKNIAKGIASGLGALALNGVNSFTDVVSYIRLFAVGLATVAIADSFNAMAMSVGYGSFFAGIVTSFIFLMGHGLNIILGPLSVLVHGVRLNVLEFCSHSNISWSGFSYKPLTEERGA